MPKLGMGFLIHGFAQHGQHHLEYYFQHFLMYLQGGGAAKGRPPFYFIFMFPEFGLFFFVWLWFR